MGVTLLKLACPDRVGLLARLTAFVAFHGGNLLEVHQFTDPISGWFFARMAIDTGTLALDTAGLRKAFSPLAKELEAEWTLREDQARMRVAILVSKLGHCLADLLWRWKAGEMPMEIPVVISNHEDFREMVEREGLRFEHVPVDAENKAAGLGRTAALLEEHAIDLVVLARYMQIIPPEVCDAWPGRIINIHHSFLPSFVGANPYRRAYDRGVKLIGATCHYVTKVLDEGPIIDQEVVRVEHFHSPEDMLRLGRDCERLALARGVRYHIHDRVLIHGKKTVVFRD
ncbi:MAG TPA: formyltetrahydrofolate deformylase [Chthoniobacteraceae bacterium]|jgi:formyltetrahydrofolate deformylase|nr:formyltetrahydrofolate deformylase [Chthoniobacteraceae bacterium]